MVGKAQTTLSDVMPVVVALGPKGFYVIRPKDGESEILASFPEDLNRVAFALFETYAEPLPLSGSGRSSSNSYTTSTFTRRTS